MRRLHNADCRTHPASQPLLHFLIIPVTEDQFSLHPHTADDMAVLPVTVGRLVFVHKIHINGAIGNLFVELGQKVAQRFFILLQADNPHLCRGKGMHPGDDTCTLRIVVGIIQGLTDGRLADQSRL